MNKPFDLDNLRTLLAVAETGSFSNAAQRIGRSQSAVSMQIQKLEQQVGRELLVRGGRAAVPTRAGNDLLAYARRMLKMSDEAWAHLTRPDITGTVRLGAPEDYAAPLLSGILEEFGKAFPRVNVELVCEPSFVLDEAINRNEIDLAVVTRFAGHPEEVLRREPMVWVASPVHAAWDSDPLPVALFQTCAARSHTLQALTDAEKTYRCTYSSASLAGLVTIVRAGLAVAGLAQCSVPSTLSIVGPREGLPPLQDLEIGLLRSASAGSTAVQGMYEAIHRNLALAGRSGF